MKGIKSIFLSICSISLLFVASYDSYGQELSRSEAMNQIIYELREHADPPTTGKFYERNNNLILEVGDSIIPINRVRPNIEGSSPVTVTFECYNYSTCITWGDREISKIAIGVDGFKSAYRFEKAVKDLKSSGTSTNVTRNRRSSSSSPEITPEMLIMPVVAVLILLFVE